MSANAESATTPATPVRAVVFDMDGLMLDTERVGMQTFATASAECGVEFPREAYLALIGRPQRDTHGILLKLLGPEFPIEAVCKRSHELYLEHVETRMVPLKEGLLALLDFIEGHHLRLAVATSTARRLALRKLTLTGIADRFPVIVCGDEVPRGKPYPDIFLEAARRLDVPPEACIALEDSIPGIKAAHAAGMRTIMVPDLIPPTDEVRTLAHAVVETLGGAIDVILRFVR